MRESLRCYMLQTGDIRLVAAASAPCSDAMRPLVAHIPAFARCQVEEYVCSKIKRNPVVSRSAAAYLGEFTAGETDAGFTKGDAEHFSPVRSKHSGCCAVPGHS